MSSALQTPCQQTSTSATCPPKIQYTEDEFNPLTPSLDLKLRAAHTHITKNDNFDFMMEFGKR